MKILTQFRVPKNPHALRRANYSFKESYQMSKYLKKLPMCKAAKELQDV
jgi:hypothetical protein